MEIKHTTFKCPYCRCPRNVPHNILVTAGDRDVELKLTCNNCGNKFKIDHNIKARRIQ